MLLTQDTAGSERYESMSRIYYRGARAAIVCYDLTEKLSFERAQFWITELRKNEEVIFFEYFLGYIYIYIAMWHYGEKGAIMVVYIYDLINTISDTY